MNATEILLEAKAAAIEAVRKDMVRFDGEEPPHMECGFAWVNLYYNRNKAPAANVEFIKALKKEAKAAGISYDSAGNRVISNTVDQDLIQAFGRPDYRPSTWQWWNPGECHWQYMHTKIVGAQAFADVLKSHGIQARVDYRYD